MNATRLMTCLCFVLLSLATTVPASAADSATGLVSGTVSGLTYGNSVTLTDNGGSPLVVTQLGQWGQNPAATLIVGNDGNFYGTTTRGGRFGAGTIFRVTPQGVLTVLHSFQGTDGSWPQTALTLGRDGNFYGTTSAGGAYQWGTAFQLTPSGGFTTLHSFGTSTTPSGPYSPLAQGPDGAFYGTDAAQGSSARIFKLQPDGTFTVVYTFAPDPTTEFPAHGTPTGPLVLDSAGNLFGTANGGYGAGGVPHLGEIYELSAAGDFHTVVVITDPTQAYGLSGLTAGPDGVLYGAAEQGGSSTHLSATPAYWGAGSILSVTPDGTFTTLYSFSAGGPGAPKAPPVRGADGNLYGTTYVSSGTGVGSLYALAPSGQITWLHTLRDSEGGSLLAGLVHGPDGAYYGAASYGGSAGESVDNGEGAGSVYRVTTAGQFAVVYPFASQLSFSFTSPLASNTAYAVAVSVQPYAATCTVTGNGTGTVGSGASTDVQVSCATGEASLEADVTGLASGTLVLSDGAGALQTVTGNGSHLFNDRLAPGQAYALTVSQQPADQTCVVSAGTGTVPAGQLTVSIPVTCSAIPRYPVGGTVTGLTSGALLLQDRGADLLTIAANGPFSFATPVQRGMLYHAKILGQPPGQHCTLANASDVVRGPVTTIDVQCVTLTPDLLGGTVTGLTGPTPVGLALRLNGGALLPIASNGTFAFPVPLLPGSPYDVTVGSQPSGQTCVINQHKTGSFAGGYQPPVTVVCSAIPRYTLGLTVDGLPLNSSLTVVVNPGGLVVPIKSTNSLSVEVPQVLVLQRGVAYSVNLKQTPPGESCVVNQGSGIATGNVYPYIVCTAVGQYALGGTVTGLTPGHSLTLTNFTGTSPTNLGGTVLPITANGPFVFPGTIARSTYFNVTAQSGPGQLCTVSPGNGLIDVNSATFVQVTCTSSSATYALGGIAFGLSGPLTLTDTPGSGAPLTLKKTGAGAFAFPTQLENSPYAITVSAQPPRQTCVPLNGTGVLGTAGIPNLEIVCTYTQTPALLAGSYQGAALWLTPAGAVDRWKLALDASGSATLSTSAPPSSTRQLSVVEPYAVGSSGTLAIQSDLPSSNPLQWSGVVRGSNDQALVLLQKDTRRAAALAVADNFAPNGLVQAGLIVSAVYVLALPLARHSPWVKSSPGG